MYSKSNRENKLNLLTQLNLLLSDQNAGTSQFTLLGETHSRRDLEFWVARLKNDPDWSPPQAGGSALALELEQTIKDRNKERTQQNVHTSSVQAYAIQVYDLLLRQVGKWPEQLEETTRAEIELDFSDKANKNLLKAGLNKVLDVAYVPRAIARRKK